MSTPKLNSCSTTEDVLGDTDLSNKVVIITGATSGIGCETAKALARHNAHVVIAARNELKALQTIQMVRADKADAKLTFIHCDLERFASVRTFCRRFCDMNLPLDILILNAAVNALPYQKTEDGHERTFQANHLSHFLMAKLLQPKLAESSRVVIVSSESHRLSTIGERQMSKDWNESNFIAFMAYNDSKLCNILMANELQGRLKDANVIVVSCHPGNLVYTNLQQHWWPLRLLYWLAWPFTKSVNQAAATVVHCACSPSIQPGAYYNHCQPCTTSSTAMNHKLAREIWQGWDDLVGNHTDYTEDD